MSLPPLPRSSNEEEIAHCSSVSLDNWKVGMIEFVQLVGAQRSQCTCDALGHELRVFHTYVFP